jgi:hypothetical protein
MEFVIRHGPLRKIRRVTLPTLPIYDQGYNETTNREVGIAMGKTRSVKVLRKHWQRNEARH